MSKKVVKNGKILTFKVIFLCQKLSEFFSSKNVNLEHQFLLRTIFQKLHFKKKNSLLLKLCRKLVILNLSTLRKKYKKFVNEIFVIQILWNSVDLMKILLWPLRKWRIIKKMLKNTWAINLKYFISVPIFQRYLVISITISKIWNDAIFYAFYDDLQWSRIISEGLF